ncbi:MAG: hypothetical protein JNK05_10685 [Myxococcales bacterium]|nr:hypothetical protein [Myxococcales bacterium]
MTTLRFDRVLASAVAVSALALSNTAHAQATPLARANAPTPSIALPLTQEGTFASPDATLIAGVSIVDRQSADLDGDGDADLLAFVDVDDTGTATAATAGRGAVVIYRDGERAWRGRTVASVPAMPFESAYNWGEVSSAGSAGATVRLLYSAAHRGRFAHCEYRLRFDREGMHVLRGPGAHNTRYSRNVIGQRRLARR